MKPFADEIMEKSLKIDFQISHLCLSANKDLPNFSYGKTEYKCPIFRKEWT